MLKTAAAAALMAFYLVLKVHYIINPLTFFFQRPSRDRHFSKIQYLSLQRSILGILKNVPQVRLKIVCKFFFCTQLHPPKLSRMVSITESRYKW